MTARQIQLLLSFLGYEPGEADGILGPKTAGSVKAFQQAEGLEPDGEPGPATQKALRQAVAREPDREEQGFWAEIPNFTREEFACKCGAYHAPYCDGWPAPMDRRAVEMAQAIRSHFGKPAHIVSGLRCRQHNMDSGGVANSQHMAGEAVDIRVEGEGAEAVLSFVRTLPGLRYAYAINDTNVHFDVPRRQ